jgi:hypothetical protein
MLPRTPNGKIDRKALSGELWKMDGCGGAIRVK